MMILLASGRCDIPAFYSEWFYRRLKEGYVDVRNPYDPHSISRIYLNERNVDGIAFCTKNPIPMLSRLHEIFFPYMFHITITPYHSDMEPYVADKQKILCAVKELSDRIGRERVFVRYDPILLNARYTVRYHAQAFEQLCRQLQGYIAGCILSFVDDYKNLRAHQKEIQLYPMKEEKMKEIAFYIGEIAKRYHISVQTCAEEIDLQAYGILNTPCFERQHMTRLFQRNLAENEKQGVRKNCACLPTVDIGDYNCCRHLCKYCYANYDEKQIIERMKRHDPYSSVLIGHVTKEDTVHIREEKTVRQETLSL